MKKRNLIIIIISNVLFNCCGSGYDSYVNDNIKPLRINGIVINKYEEHTGCFGAIIIRQKNSVDTIRNIFTCTPEDEKIWYFVQPNDSLYKEEGALEMIVVRNGHKTEFTFPTKD